MAQNFQGNFNPIFRPSVLQQLGQQQVVTMPPPTSIPWTVEGMPWAQQRIPNAHSQLMQFEAHQVNNDQRLHVKRKSNINPTFTPTMQPRKEPNPSQQKQHEKQRKLCCFSPVKQFISEEKISAHFNGLHISNDFTQNANSTSMEDALMSSSTSSGDEYRVTAKELEEKLKNANRITVCEDVLKMHKEQKNFPLLPDALINHIEKPCTALVLWQPPPILELLHRKNEEELKRGKNASNNFNRNASTPEDLIDDIEFSDAEEIDDFIDNNNTCNVDYNDVAQMDEDL